MRRQSAFDSRSLSVPVLPFLLALVCAPPGWGRQAASAEAEASAEEAVEWEVANPPGEPYGVEIDTDEGTWINLDVSPDGGEIVFDLLGDLYLLPIDGGDARPLTSGFAWDMQPRFSPDGNRIACTSDRGGGDNIWVMKRDGSDPQPVTDESFRLLNNAAWSPDGEYLAARKHFTSRRSLGAGEIWLYHRSGGKGLQLIEKPDEQKDLGEPAFSPDGRYVYFSRDTTPGGVFEYNKDSNGEIYTIQRLDRETGEIEPFITGAGGAVRPTPSPDGRHLAFVRRVRFQSVLFVHDLESGRNRALYDRLDRDMQETWAVHGVYANFAWTPDSASIVFWSGGKIRRVDVASGEVRVVPFRVRQTQPMMEALRFPVEVAPERFPTRALRWVRVSPRGDRAVFQALGRLWLQDLPDGRPRRLTSQEEHFELYPSFSRDGEQLVYVTWDDRELGSVRLLAARPGSEGRRLTPKPGHYVEPALSPDGERVVYRRLPGDRVRGPYWGHDAGLYVVPAAGGDPERLRRQGRQPHFAGAADRVYFVELEEPEEKRLRSVELDGSDERTHLASKNATEIRLSPDGRWVAFSERYNAYLMPFTPAARPIEIGPGTDALPLRKVSRDAGEGLHWSGDSRTLFWSVGPELFRQPLENAFSFLDGSPEELPDPPAEGMQLGMTVASDTPSGAVLLDGARLITLGGSDAAEVIERGTILVDGNRIVAVGRQGEVASPPGALRLDLSGHTIMPGIVDVHWHGAQGTAEIHPEHNWTNYAALAFGVTTVHDPSTDTSTFFAASELQRAGRITAPRLFSTGTILYGAGGDIRVEIESLEAARAHLRRLQAVGAFSVKSYNQPRRDQRQQIVAAARELGMMVVNEGGALFQHNMTMVADGHTGIEHSLSVARIYDDVLQFWSQSRTGNTPTLVVAYGGIEGERYWYHHTNVWENERLLTFVPRELVDASSRRRMMAPEEEYNHFRSARIGKQLADAGVSIQVGAHGQREGLGAHWEIWMLAQGGMTPLEAIRAATLNGARYLGLDGDLGSLEAGKLADLLVLESSPLEEIRNTESVRYTMLNGRLYDARTMNEVGNHPRERGRFWWETGE